MAKVFAHMRLIAGALALGLVVATAMPAAAQQPSSVNPTAAAVKEQQLLQQLKMIEGRGTIPDVKSYVLEHPAGREWREYRTVTLKWIGGIAILGILALLTIYYLWHGTMRIEAGRSGRTILRFNVFERFVHWLTAVTFVILAITGLNITFGRSLILPWLGPSAFSEWSEWAKFSHNYLSFAFTAGLVLMFLIWVARNLPSHNDVVWFKNGGGMFGGREPPAEKFNGGEKLIFWISTIGGGLVIATGFVLLFPFYGTTVANMELAEIVHSVVAVLYVSAMFVHIYMGTIGVEGAFEAMAEGTVDVNWAKERHSLWYEEEKQLGAAQGQAMRPAE
jgi:formate dehydrogenase subunit gamma